MARHPSDEDLLAACEAASGTILPGVAAHLAQGCTRCEERLEQYRAVLASLRTPPLDIAPEELIRAALERLREAASSANRPRREGSRIAAALRDVSMRLALDTRLTPATTGLRGAAAAARRVIYDAPEASLHLEVRPTARGRNDLLGQIVSQLDSLDPAGARIHIDRARRHTSVTAQATGEFHLAGIPDGPIEIRIECGDRILRAGPLEL